MPSRIFRFRYRLMIGLLAVAFTLVTTTFAAGSAVLQNEAIYSKPTIDPAVR